MNPIPLTRHDALADWSAFLPGLGDYAMRRNHVEPHHRNVSRLSVALCHRILLEDEVVFDTLRNYEFHTVEKWLQEVCWRRYWKGWLEQRPDVWSTWQRRVRELHGTLPEAVLRRAQAVAAGESSVACMDAIARELITTGYLHNHARMWWASFWIHVERLPWELGAEWFFRNLLDADPASNTLSWRWVAGLQTPGKTYLVRESNIAKYAPEFLLRDRAGIERIADGAVTPAVAIEFANTALETLPDYPGAVPDKGRRIGIWLHADDLLPEIGPLANLSPIAVAAFTSKNSGPHYFAPNELRMAALGKLLADGLARAAAHFQCSTELNEDDDPAASICNWAAIHGIEEVVSFAPTVGPVGDLVPQLQQRLNSAGIALTLIRRCSDTHAFKLAVTGFFPFWGKMSRHLNQLTSQSADR